ncbi:MAG TPA: biotin/lipoyl-containing protein [bacterium]|nr:biotin/lipoyl-containing protein [bacterium]
MADIVLLANGRRLEARIETRDGETVVRIAGAETRLRLQRLDPTTWRFAGEDGTTRIARAVEHAGTWWLHLDGEIMSVRRAEPAARRRTGARRPEGLEAPMPGAVTQVAVHEGDAVTAGQPIVIIEAMKMEHVIRAPHAGRVVALRVRAGDQVEAGTVVAELQSAGASAAEPEAHGA